MSYINLHYKKNGTPQDSYTVSLMRYIKRVALNRPVNSYTVPLMRYINLAHSSEIEKPDSYTVLY